MSDIIIIKNPDGGSYGPDAMSNSVCICDCIFKDAKDGDTVKGSFEGVLIDHADGKRYIAIHTIDGAPVEEMTGDYGPNPPSHDQMMNMDAQDALMNFMKQMKG